MSRSGAFELPAYVGDDEVTVRGMFHAGYAQTYLQPGEPPECEIDAILLDGADVTDALSDDELCSVQEQLLENEPDDPRCDDERDER